MAFENAAAPCDATSVPRTTRRRQPTVALRSRFDILTLGVRAAASGLVLLRAACRATGNLSRLARRRPQGVAFQLENGLTDVSSFHAGMRQLSVVEIISSGCPLISRGGGHPP